MTPRDTILCAAIAFAAALLARAARHRIENASDEHADWLGSGGAFFDHGSDK